MEDYVLHRRRQEIDKGPGARFAKKLANEQFFHQEEKNSALGLIR